MAKYTVGDIFEGDYPITQYYGERVEYYKSISNGGLTKGHEGVDWGTPTGVKVLAPFKRNIILRDNDDFKNNAYGDFVVIWDPDQKCAVWYGHLLENNVSFGQELPYGAVIGKTDNSGNTSGPHLHVNFVETDDKGNRLNTNNGNLGFLNILDANLVQWNLGGQGITGTPTPIADDMTDEQKRVFDSLTNYRKERVKGTEGSFEGFINAIIGSDKDITGVIRQRDDYQTANNIQANQIVALNIEIGGLQSQLKDATSKTQNTPQIPPLSKEDINYLQQFVTWLKKLFPKVKKPAA